MQKLLIWIIAVIIGISVLSVILVDSITGNVAVNGYGANKVYGGAIGRAYAGTTPAMGEAYMRAMSTLRHQEYMYSNQDKWDCNFDSSDGPYPCIFDDAQQKWCCVLK